MNCSASRDYRGDGRIVQNMVIMQNIGKLVFSPEDEVLDVGCGSGEETKSVATNVKSVTAVDISDEMLAVALENNTAPNITYCKGDAQTVGDNPDWRGRFDKVLCYFVLHWVPDETRALRSALACLKPAGEALFIIDGDDDNFPLAEASRFVKCHEKWGPYVKGYRPTLRLWSRSVVETEELMRACGWATAHCEIQRHESCMSEVQLKLVLKTCLGETNLIPLAEQDAYLEDLWRWELDRYEDKSLVAHIAWHVNMVVIHARK